MRHEVYVDAGLIWIGDPCYVLGDDASHKVTDWTDFCNKMNTPRLEEGEGVSAPLGKGVGLAISTGYGDGCYPVHVEHNSEGRVSKVTITFIDDHDIACEQESEDMSPWC